MIRLFAALAIPPAVAEALEPRQRGIEAARWRDAADLHVTLRFFGEVREDVARDLDIELAQIHGRPFEILLEGAGSFGEGREINAVWAGVADNPELSRLAAACEGAARRAGLKPEGRRYRPHVTLAYLRRGDPDQVGRWVQVNNLLKSPPIAIDRFVLFSSHQTKGGSHYRAEAEYLLE